MVRTHIFIPMANAKMKNETRILSFFQATDRPADHAIDKRAMYRKIEFKNKNGTRKNGKTFDFNEPEWNSRRRINCQRTQCYANLDCICFVFLFLQFFRNFLSARECLLLLFASFSSVSIRNSSFFAFCI